MSELLSEQARATCLQAVRTIYPHDGLPDEAYEKVVRAVEARGGRRRGGRGDAATTGSPTSTARLVASLDAGARLDAIRATRAPRSSSCCTPTPIVELYDNPLVWKAFGYEGPSTHLGGYVDRGFDDLDWLPDPPLALDPTAGSHHA